MSETCVECDADEKVVAGPLGPLCHFCAPAVIAAYYGGDKQ